ncbi:MAG: hypothetical protein EOM24_13805 [Chloroflexia bacterium]|nr:hypothetical protein [Chloroflexia bacterium]
MPEALFDHLILTRFNVRIGQWIQQPPDEAWLTHRFELFERFCLPSLEAQTCQHFRWLVLFDAETPEPFRAKIATYAAWPNFQPIYLQHFTLESLLVVLQPYVQTPYLITTRLDNDDALSRRFVEQLQRQFAFQAFEFINFADGYTLDLQRRRLFMRNYTSNSFISLIERADNPRTVLCRNHTFLSEIGPIKNLRTDPMWLQLVHQRNLGNEVAIWPRASMTQLRDDFVLPDPTLYERQANERWMPITNVFSRTYRLVRAIAREVRDRVASRQTRGQS